MRIVKVFSISLFVSFFLPPVLAQQPATTACVASDEPIYEPGVNGVKPPEMQKDEDWKHTPGANGPFSIELLLNSEGHICRVRLLTAKNREAAADAAKYIGEYWKFKPAMRKGKPVAVSVKINFNIGQSAR